MKPSFARLRRYAGNRAAPGAPVRFHSTPPESRAAAMAALLITLIVLFGASEALSGAELRPLPAKHSYLVRVIEEQTPVPLPETRTVPPPVVTMPTALPKPDKTTRSPNPRPLVASTHRTADKPSDRPPKEVFGVDPDSVAPGGDGPAVPVGNALDKEPDPEFTPPDQVQSIFSPRETDRAPALTKTVKPEYPWEARRDGIEGVVKISLIVDENGLPTELKVVKGIGHGCDEAALQAVREFRFSPGVKDGRPVKVRLVVPIVFKLEDN